MIGRGGAAGQQQLRHRHGDAEIERLRRQPRPHRIERLQPRKQLAVERRRQRAGQRLVEMVVGVDQPGQHHMVAGLEERRRRLGLAAPGYQLDDPAILDDNAALGAVGENGQRILDPHCARGVHALTISRKVGIADAPPSLQFKDQLDPCGSWRRTCKTSYREKHLVESTSPSMDLNTIREVARPSVRAQLPVWTAGDAWLAGGTWLFSEPQIHLRRLIDLADFKWPALTIGDAGLSIAATCTVCLLYTSDAADDLLCVDL